VEMHFYTYAHMGWTGASFSFFYLFLSLNDLIMQFIIVPKGFASYISRLIYSHDPG